MKMKRLAGPAALSAAAAAVLLGAAPAGANDHVGCITCEPVTGQSLALQKVLLGPGQAATAFEKFEQGPAFEKLGGVFGKLELEGPFWK